MLAMENAIKQFTATEKDEKEPEPIARNVSDLLDELIEQSVKVLVSQWPDEQGGQGSGHPVSEPVGGLSGDQVRRQSGKILRYFQIYPISYIDANKDGDK